MTAWRVHAKRRIALRLRAYRWRGDVCETADKGAAPHGVVPRPAGETLALTQREIACFRSSPRLEWSVRGAIIHHVRHVHGMTRSATHPDLLPTTAVAPPGRCRIHAPPPGRNRRTPGKRRDGGERSDERSHPPPPSTHVQRASPAQRPIGGSANLFAGYARTAAANRRWTDRMHPIIAQASSTCACGSRTTRIFARTRIRARAEERARAAPNVRIGTWTGRRWTGLAYAFDGDERCASDGDDGCGARQTPIVDASKRAGPSGDRSRCRRTSGPSGGTPQRAIRSLRQKRFCILVRTGDCTRHAASLRQGRRTQRRLLT